MNRMEEIIIIILLISFIICVMYSVICKAILNKIQWNTETEPFLVEYIRCLESNNRFYIRSRYVNGDLYYHYMVNNGGYKTSSIEANTTTVYISDGDYRVEWYTEKKKWLFIEDWRTVYKIYIPSDSIEEYSGLSYQDYFGVKVVGKKEEKIMSLDKKNQKTI